MKTPSRFLVVLLLALLGSPVMADLIEIKVQRRILEKEERLNRPRLQTEEQMTVLELGITNKTGKVTTGLEVEWAVVVSRGGTKPDLLASGTETLASMPNSKTLMVTTDAFPVVKNRVGKQDVEYKVIVNQDGKEIGRTLSNKDFDQLAAAAHPQKGQGKKKKKP